MVKTLLKTKRLWTILASILLGLYLIQFNSIPLSNIEYSVNGKPSQKTQELPHFGSSGPHTKITYNFDLNHTWPQSSNFRIIPDDCLKKLYINQKEVQVKHIIGNACDYTKGVQVELQDYLQVGTNHFQVEINNNGGKYGLRIELLGSIMTPISYSLIGFGLIVLIWWITKGLRFPPSIRLLLIAGTLLRMLYFEGTPPLARAYDVDGHIKYIDFIALENKIPDSDDCWQCYHPIGYYASVGLYAKPFLALTEISKDSIYQSFTLILDFAFLIFSILFFRNILTSHYLVLASAILIFWPSGIIHAGRIGNDHLVYVIFAAGLYFLNKYNSRSRLPIVLTTLCVCLSVFVKTNGIVLGFPLVIYYFLRRYFVDKYSFVSTLRGTSFILLGIGLALLINLSPAIYKVYQGQSDQILVGNASALNSGLKVNSGINNFLIFDSKDYLEVPFTNPWSDRGGRQYFWNYIFKTSLFGEFQHPQASQSAALGLKLLFLFSILAMGVGLIYPHVQHKAGPGIYLLSGLGLLIAAILFRIKLPFSCANDFRYIYPLILTWIPLTLSGLHKMSLVSKWIKALPIVYMTLWLILTISFLLGILSF